MPQSAPLICPTASGGAIDANTFVAANGTRYLLWKKTDAIGQPAPCGWSRRPTTAPPWSAARRPWSPCPAAGDRGARPGPAEQPVRAVLLARHYGGCDYYTSYATATSLTGTWTHASPAFMTQANTGICGPGGADVITAADGLTGGDKCSSTAGSSGARQLYSIDLSWVNDLPVQGGRRALSLDGDARSEIASWATNGELRAWHNDGGFATMPYGNSVIIATGSAIRRGSGSPIWTTTARPS